jgi:hypothetical protein
MACVWANIHAGGSMFAPVIFFIFACSAIFQKYIAGRTGISMDFDPALRKRILLFILTFLLMLPMPGLIRGIYSAQFMYQGSWILIPEWYPSISYLDPRMTGETTLHNMICALIPYFSIVIFGIFLIIRIVKSGLRIFISGTDTGIVLIMAMLLVFSISSARFVYYSIFPLVFIACFFPDQVIIKERKLSRYAGILFFLLAAAFFSLSIQYSIYKQQGGIFKAFSRMSIDHEPGEFPEKAADFMKNAGVNGKIFHYAKWGGYLLYRLFPYSTVFADGRGNFNDSEMKTLIETHKPYMREDTLKQAFDSYHFQIVMFPEPVFPLYVWDKNIWFLAFRGSGFEIFLARTENNLKNFENIRDYYSSVSKNSELNTMSFMKDGKLSHSSLDTLEDFIIAFSGKQFIEQDHIRKRLKKIENIEKNPGDDKLISVRMDHAMILFAASNYAGVSEILKDVLSKSEHNSSAVLYSGWTGYLKCREDYYHSLLNSEQYKICLLNVSEILKKIEKIDPLKDIRHVTKGEANIYQLLRERINSEISSL